jgi:hypothetical protein
LLANAIGFHGLDTRVVTLHVNARMRWFTPVAAAYLRIIFKNQRYSFKELSKYDSLPLSNKAQQTPPDYQIRYTLSN